jgi:hypothetical protein
VKRWGIILLIVVGALVPSGHLVGGQDGRATGGAPGEVAGPTLNASVVNDAVPNGSIQATSASERSCALEASGTLADARPQGSFGPGRAYCPIDESRQR